RARRRDGVRRVLDDRRRLDGPLTLRQGAVPRARRSARGRRRHTEVIPMSSSQATTASPGTPPPSRNPFARAMRPLNSLVERFIPSALVFAIVLTAVVAVLALALTD